jgi:hypothetical protein
VNSSRHRAAWQMHARLVESGKEPTVVRAAGSGLSLQSVPECRPVSHDARSASSSDQTLQACSESDSDLLGPCHDGETHRAVVQPNDVNR